ncbi:MAG: hypothetical protein IT236_15605 [Bacteroidia bacterium]|nr:hypothetical protein [Bacteroidia bacterium]
MKKINLNSVIVICALALFSCDNKTETAKMGNGGNDNEPVCGSIELPVDTAVKCIKRYDSLWKASHAGQPAPVRAFTIRAVDLLKAMGMPTEMASDTNVCKYNHVRVYLGQNYDNAYKLFITPVSGANLCNSVGGADVILSNTKATPSNYVLDLNAPCPQVCASNSVLNPNN